MKRKYLIQYAAIMTGLFLDVFTAAVLGWFSKLDIIGIAFGATMLFIVGYAGTVLVMETLMAKEKQRRSGEKKTDNRQVGRRRKRRSAKKSLWKSVKRHLPYHVWYYLAYREWKKRKRQETGRRPEPQIYTLTGGLEEMRSHDDRDMMQIVPVWTARKEGA